MLPKGPTADQMTFKVLFEDSSDCGTKATCVDIQLTPIGADLAKNVLVPQVEDDPADTSKIYAYFQENVLHFFVLDDKAAFKVRGTAPNQISYTLRFRVKP